MRLEVRSRKEGYATMLEIRVSDEGVGIKEDEIRRIIHYIRSRGSSDTFDEEFEALGFATIGYAVNAMSGEVRIESELGKGSTFIITIPQVEG